MSPAPKVTDEAMARSLERVYTMSHIWPDTDAHPAIGQLRYDSPLEQLFAHLAEKYFKRRELRSQVSVGRYRLDFVFEQVAFECDGFRFHASKTQQNFDAMRDDLILKTGAVSAIYRIPGRILHGWPQPCFATFAAFDPQLFSSRGLINLERYARRTNGLGIVRKSLETA